jgi:hypothetical protein
MAFIDDDDSITDAYIEDVVATIQGSYPAMRLRGQIGPYTFTHSLDNKLTDPMVVGDVFLRPPNHLNPMLTDIAKLIRFGDAVRGEDLDWTIRLAKTRFLTHEYKSNSDRIHYIYNIGSRIINEGTLENQRRTSYETMLKMVWTPNRAVLPSSGETPRGPILRLGPHGFVSR